jgi:hypothetical protein
VRMDYDRDSAQVLELHAGLDKALGAGQAGGFSWILGPFYHDWAKLEAPTFV